MQDNLSEYLSQRPNIERYMNYMNSSVGDKLTHILPIVEQAEGPHPNILSIGAGTGVLEKAIANIIPDSRIVALDASMPMLQEIDPGKKDDITNSTNNIERVQGDAGNIPFQEGSFDVVIASSVVHEIASYRNDFQFDEGVKDFFKDVAKVLKKGGRLVVRDFMQPANPERELKIVVGEKQEEDEMDPCEFLERFCEEFEGVNLDYIKRQIKSLKEEGKWGKGAEIKAKSADTFEIAAHFSWSKSFDEEIKERYAYLPVREYAQFIVEAFQDAGEDCLVEDRRTYLQPGYPDHINGRLDLRDENGQQIPLPDFTGIVTIQKI